MTPEGSLGAAWMKIFLEEEGTLYQECGEPEDEI